MLSPRTAGDFFVRQPALSWIRTNVIGVFVDTSTVNKMLVIHEKRANDAKHEEDRDYLARIIEKYANPGKIRLWVNPSVEQEIESTECLEKRALLREQFSRLSFTPFTTTLFPIVFGPEGATFLTDEQKSQLRDLYEEIPSYRKDEKIFADSAFNSRVRFLLSTDRRHLVKKRFRDILQKFGLDKKVIVCNPRELFERLEGIDWKV